MSKLSTVAYEYIKGNILSTKYPPGTRLTEDMIAIELSISRTPVREAFQRLASEQVLTLYPSRYAEVTTFDATRIRRIGAIRLALDMLSVYSCTHNGSVREFNELDTLETQYETAIENDDVAAYIRLECDFHLKITEISKNMDLLRQQENLYVLIHMILNSRKTSKDELLIKIQEHRQLIKAIRTQDTVTARQILCKHHQKTHGLSDSFIQYFD